MQKWPDVQYIGETVINFRYGFNNHTHTIRQKNRLPLPLHFNADDHNVKDCILKVKLIDTKHRKLTELQFMNNFETNKFVFIKPLLSSAYLMLLSIKVKYFKI